MRGLRLRNPDNTIKLDITDRLPRFIGSFSTGTNNGSIYHGQSPPSKIWIYTETFEYADAFQNFIFPVITVSDYYITWTYQDISSFEKIAVNVVYGCY